MWYRLRKVDLDFLDAAKKKYVTECDVNVARSDVWRAFVDPSTWKHWWPGLSSASYSDNSQPGVGTRREATLKGHRFEETIVVWEEGRRWGYYIDGTNVPIATAQLECTEFEDCARGTRVRWILAQDPRLIMRLASPIFPWVMQSIFRKAMSNLERHLGERKR
jgi:uncharacterized protein YndB with AHSA1/START domain